MTARQAYLTQVRTVKLEREATDWTQDALAARKWDTLGVIVGHHDSHGFVYEIRHADGSVGCYEPHEVQKI